MDGYTSFVHFINFEIPKYINAIKLLMKGPTVWDVIAHRMIVAWVSDVVV